MPMDLTGNTDHGKCIRMFKSNKAVVGNNFEKKSTRMFKRTSTRTIFPGNQNCRFTSYHII